MKQLLFIVIIVSLFSGKLLAQHQGRLNVDDSGGCQAFFPMTPGASFEMTDYKDNGKLIGKSKHTVLSRGFSAKRDTVVVQCERMDKNGELLSTSRYDVGCKTGTFEIDFSIFMNNRSLKAYKGIETRASQQRLEVPIGVKVGDQLIESTMKIEFEDEAVTYGESEIRIYDRYVVACDTLETPAGKFICWKVAYKMETTVKGVKPVKVKSSGAEWYAPEVGIVRAEYYDAEGKRYGYSEMTAIKQ